MNKRMVEMVSGLLIGLKTQGLVGWGEIMDAIAEVNTIRRLAEKPGGLLSVMKI
jgi:hypothetical protein